MVGRFPARSCSSEHYRILEENKPNCDGWKVFDAVGVEPVFPKEDHAIDYAQGCASIRETVAVTAQASDESAASDEVAGLL